jgi:pimeloyl-ACP methyl ester carboxylesterase
MDVQTPQASSAQVLSDLGSGRSFIIVVDDNGYLDLARAIAAAISSRARAVIIQSQPITAVSWGSCAASFGELLTSLGVRQASFIGLSAGATLVQNLALENPRIVRTLVIVDASLRPHPSRAERVLDAIERRFPFGLPLRLGSTGFNVRAFAHRLRCPMLLVSTCKASHFVANELKRLGAVAPTAWYVSLGAVSGVSEAQELCELVLSFQDTAAKCPQKNLQEAV